MKRLQENLYRVSINMILIAVDGRADDNASLQVILSESSLDELIKYYNEGDTVGFGDALNNILGNGMMPIYTAGESQNGSASWCAMTTDELVVYYMDGNLNKYTAFVGWDELSIESIQAMPIYSASLQNMIDM